VTLSNGQQALVNTPVAPVQALVNTPQIATAVEKGVDTFMEAVPTLMKALDEVAKVHLFISGRDGSVLKLRVLADGPTSCCPRIQGCLHA
jgi:hypothetical protein